MKGPAEWGRRQGVFGAGAALAGGAAQWLSRIGQDGAAIAAAVVTVGLLLALVWIAVLKGGTERAQEEESERRGIPFQGLLREATDETPIQTGVDPAAMTDLLPGGRLPQYQPRDEDEGLRAAIRDSLDGGSERRLVVAMGPSKRGKPRALYEALRSVDADDGRSLYLVAPVSVDAVRQLLDVSNDTLDRPDDQVVLWLDDLEPFVNGGLSPALLTEWLDRFGGIAVGTVGGKGADIVADRGGPSLVTPMQGLLEQGHEVDVSSLTVVNADIAVTAEQVSEISQHGLAAYLVAGPALRRALQTNRHGAEPECPVGVDIVRAAADWSRCGRTDPIPKDLLNDLVWAYPHPGQGRGHGFGEGLLWALGPVAGSIALLRVESTGFVPYSYAVTLLHDLHSAAPPQPVWDAAIRMADAPQLFAVGVAAYEQQQFPTAVDAWQQVLDRFGDDPAPGLREPVAMALVGQGVDLGAVGRQDDAIAAYQQLLDRFGDDPAPAMQELVSLVRRLFSQPR